MFALVITFDTLLAQLAKGSELPDTMADSKMYLTGQEKLCTGGMTTSREQTQKRPQTDAGHLRILAFPWTRHALSLHSHT